MKWYLPVSVVLLLACMTACTSFDIQSFQHGTFSSDSLYIKDVRIHNEQYRDIKDSLASHIVFNLKKYNLKAASYFNTDYRESDFSCTAIIDVFITTTGDILDQKENISIFVVINDTQSPIATIQILSNNFSLKQSLNQAAIAKAIAQYIDAMVVKK